MHEILWRFCEAGILNPRPTLPTSSYKQHYPVNNLKRPIKCNYEPPKFDMVTPYFNDNKFITSVNTENNFIIPAHGIIINKDQDRKDGLKIYRCFPSDEPNPMVCHRLLYYGEGNIKASKPDHTKKICLVTLKKISVVTPEDKFFCHAQVIMTSRDQGRNWDLIYPWFPQIMIIIS